MLLWSGAQALLYVVQEHWEHPSNLFGISPAWGQPLQEPTTGSPDMLGDNFLKTALNPPLPVPEAPLRGFMVWKLRLKLKFIQPEIKQTPNKKLVYMLVKVRKHRCSQSLLWLQSLKSWIWNVIGSSSGDPINSESLSPSGHVSTGTCQVSFPRDHSESLFCQAKSYFKKQTKITLHLNNLGMLNFAQR